jgi:LysM repeat protein
MKRSLIICVLVLLLPGLIAACNPTIPQPPPPTQTVVKAVSTQTLIAAAGTQTPTTAAQPTTLSTSTIPPTSAECPPPAGWSPYVIKPGDTLYALAQQFKFTAEEIMQGNCLTSPTVDVGKTIYLPLESCTITPPPGWKLYTVRSGDTLFRLATTRDTIIEEVKRVNCLISDNLDVGQQLYLPPLVLPPAPPAPPPGAAQPAIQAALSSPFAMRSHALNSLLLAIPSQNKDAPCKEEQRSPWIDVVIIGNHPTDTLELGERVYYFACEFPDPGSLTARLSGPWGTEDLDMLYYPPTPDQPMHKAQAVAVWNATCDLPVETTYTLTMEDEKGNQAPPHRFTLKNMDTKRILAVPQTVTAGRAFQIYYCGYQADAGKSVTIDLYYGAAHGPKGKYDFHHATSWQVLIGPAGWTTERLMSSTDDRLTAYLLRLRDKESYDFIWLYR